LTALNEYCSATKPIYYAHLVFDDLVQNLNSHVGDNVVFNVLLIQIILELLNVSCLEDFLDHALAADGEDRKINFGNWISRGSNCRQHWVILRLSIKFFLAFKFFDVCFNKSVLK